MKLFVNGCSHSAGDGTSTLANSWPNQLAGLLGADLINYSLSGASNQRMIRTTREWLSSIDVQKKHFVIIGWSSWEREEWYHNQQFYQVNAGGHSRLPRELKDRYMKYVSQLDNNGYVNAAKDTEEEIYQLAEDLQYYQVEYLFFNSFMQISETLKNNRWDYRYMTPFSNELNYFTYLEQAGHLPESGRHFKDVAQTTWAQVVFQYIKKHYDIQPH